ncbi:terminase large subunit domain-containing protein [Vibrio lentus]|uniref:terminase large subunit domain-containing protein n=1 Tax=Vibrio lentus TaxID=136468 RepID=UPI0010BD414A|nr:terminase family protein [Vibrio lentus]TKG17747.1 hypothetical protein FCW05_12635 [Vibrio lentus]
MNLSTYTNEDLANLLDQIIEHKKFNQLEDFSAYPWQSEFMAASTKYHQRYLRAGNQTGKTLSQGMEVAQHISGRYQDWYEGTRIEGSDNLFWCIGIDLDATANVMMYELFGTKDIRMLDEVGSGSIPKDCIDFDTMVKDGRRLISCRIKHFDKDGVFDGYNTLQFFGAQQGFSKMMGSRVKYAWIDEIPQHNSMEIFTQCIARTINTDGFVTITGTPEQGRLELDVMFEEDESNELYLRQVSWDDCPHIDEETERRLLAAFPEWQHQMRKHGLPVIGTGAVFAFSDSAISTDKKDINNWEQILWAIDIGRVNDPTVITLAKKVEVDGVDEITILEQYKSEEDRSPVWVNSVISEHTYRNAPVIYPHDASGDGGYASVLKRLGLNVPAKPFYNPQMTDAELVNPSSSHSRSIEAGLYYMEQFFKEGKLKVHEHCFEWFKEKAGYYRTGKNGANAFAGEDHAIDSSRYAFMSLLGNRGTPAGQAQKQYTDFNNGFANYEDEVVGVPFS